MNAIAERIVMGKKSLTLIVWFVFGLAVTTTLAQAEDMASMISQYRRAHGLSAVRTDPQLTAIAQRQAHAMAGSGVMDHSVAGPFATRIAGAHVNSAAENIAMGTKTWAGTLQLWKSSAGHNANLLLPGATSVGLAVAYNAQTRYKAFWAMVIARKGETRRLRR
jgi:uncharacterized protein YkwD